MACSVEDPQKRRRTGALEDAAAGLGGLGASLASQRHLPHQFQAVEQGKSAEEAEGAVGETPVEGDAADLTAD